MSDQGSSSRSHVSMLVHFCEYCSYNTTVSHSSSVPDRLYFCSHCGRASPGAELNGRSQAAAMSHSQQDELSQLFARNMNVSQPMAQHPATPDKQFIMEQPAQPPQIIYSSQHYTGTSYLCPTEPPADSRADSPLSFPVDDINDTLRRNDIDPASLSITQFKLFTNADYEQRLRLLELWRISPPEHGSHTSREQSFGDSWPQTSIAQEEEMARLRYERRLNLQNQQDQQNPYFSSHEAEPYVLTGYANAQRIDPVYAAAAGLWQAPNYSQAVQDMGTQYGAYQQVQHSQGQNVGIDQHHDDMML